MQRGRLEGFFRNHDAVFLLIDGNTGELLDANDGALAFYGYSLPEIRSMKIGDINQLPPDELEAERLSAVRAERRYFVERHRLASGEVRTVEVCMTPAVVDGEDCLFSAISDVTELVRVPLDVQEQTRALAEAQRVAGMGSWEWEIAADKITWSNELYRLNGRDPALPAPGYEEHLNTYTPDSAQRLDTAVQAAMNGTPYELELELVRPDGSHWNGVARGEPVLGPDGDVEGLRGTLMDITERKKAEESLRESREMLTCILDSVPQSIFWKDSDGVYLGCNRALVESAGLESPAQVIGTSDYDLPWSADEADAYRRDDLQVLSTAEPKMHIIEPMRRADGVSLLVDTTKIPLLDASGMPYALLGIFEDVTESNRAEQALRKSEARYRLLYENMNEGVIFHVEGGATSMNPAAARLFGLPPEEVGSATSLIASWRTIHEDGSEFPRSEHPAFVSLRTGLPVLNVTLGVYVTTRNELRWLRVSALPMPEDGESVPREVFMTVTDVTELKRSHQSIARAHELLASLRDATAHFLAHAELDDCDIEAALRAIAVAADADGAQICSCCESPEGQVLLNRRPVRWRRMDGGTLSSPDESELGNSFRYWRESFLAGAVTNERVADMPAAMRGEFERRGVSAVLAVPIFSAGKLWGFAALEASKSRMAWDSDVVETLRSATSRMGMSIDTGARALHDPLTGLYNRRYLEEVLGQALARSKREAEPLGLMMFDVDGFKGINDSGGHEAGDEVLRELARGLRKQSRAQDTAARVGGDEFVVVMPNATLEAALVSAERWRGAVEDDSPSWGAERDLRVTVSVGVCSTATAQTVHELLSQADTAMYTAKTSGRNRVRGYVQ